MLLRLLLFAIFFSSTLLAGPVFYAISFKAPEVSPVGFFGTIDPGTGVVTQIGPNTPDLSHDIAVSPAGTVYAIFDQSLHTIDKNTGVVSAPIGVLPAGVHSIAFRHDGALFGISTSDLYTLDPVTAGGVHIGSLGLAPNLDNIRFDAGGNLYTMTAEPNSLLYRVNQTTAVPTFIGASGTDDI